MQIQTHYDPKPFPSRAFDWSAIDAHTYDITGTDEDGSSYSNHPVGYGRTEAGAIADLQSQLEG